MWRAAIIALATSMLVACGGGGSSHDAAPADPIAHYRAALRPLVADETAAMRAIRANTGDAFSGDTALLSALREQALPKYSEFVTGLAAISPAEPALAAFHHRLVTAAEDQLGVLRRLETAVAAQNGTLVLMVNRDQVALSAELAKLTAEFDSLATTKTTPR